MRNVSVIKANFMAFWTAFSHKKEWGHLLYISLLHYTGIIATSTWIRFQLPISVVFWQASPVSVWACEGAELHVPLTQKEHVLPGL